MRIKLAVVDGAEVFRAGIQKIVSATDTIQLVGIWEELPPFVVWLSEEQKVDVLVLGDNVSPADLKHAITDLMNTYPTLKIMVLATAFSAEMINVLFRNGVLGFICKEEALGEYLVGAMRAVKRGDVFLSPQTARMVLVAAEPKPVSLTQRQKRVLEYMAHYMSAQEIAQSLNVSLSSVYNTQHRLRQAFGAGSNEEVLIKARRLGLIQ